jgi:dTDP-4-dehydrorhamnose 3,5-epimerase
MKVMETNLPGVKVIEPKVFVDHRGWFMEIYVQVNQSFSTTKGTLRGLHYQTNPKAQTKLVRCTRGEIFDVVVDIRKGSPTHGEWYGVELTAENKKQLLVPKGFAHGFMTLTENTEVQYKVDEMYSPECDSGIAWNDPSIGVKWPMDIKPVLSEKDENAPQLEEANNDFIFEE